MARLERNEVDYFPHSVNHGKKMFYLRDKYGNDGYAVWFMLLEHLGKASYHYLNLSDEIELMYLSSEFKVSELVLKEIINSLVKFGEFDKQLWEENSILFNEKFIGNISDAYKKRNNNCINKKSLLTLLAAKGVRKEPKGTLNPQKGSLKGDSNPQRIGKDRIGKERIKDINEIYSRYPAKCPIKNSSTGKSTKDKDKIKTMLSSISKDDLVKTIDYYIADCKTNNVYMKNFSTFLNKLPDLEEIKKEESSPTNKYTNYKGAF